MTEDNQIDDLFDWVDDHLCDGNFLEVDKLLLFAYPEQLTNVMIVAVMSITFAAKDKLIFREQWLINAERALRERGYVGEVL